MFKSKYQPVTDINLTYPNIKWPIDAALCSGCAVLLADQDVTERLGRG